jgi:hypothetical protein
MLLNHLKFLLLSGIAFLFSYNLLAQPGSFEMEYGTSQPDFAVQMIPCSDGGFLQLSWRGGFFHNEAIIIRLDISGNIIWEKSIKDTSAWQINPICCIQTHDLGFCILAQPRYKDTASFHLCGKSALIRLDPSGQLLWVSAIGNPWDSFIGKDLSEASDGSFYITGQYWAFCAASCPLPPYVLKTNSLGQFLWYKNFPNLYSYHPARLKANTDTTFLLAINGPMGFLIFEMDSSGNTLTEKNYNDTTGISFADWEIDSNGKIKTLLINNNGNVLLSKLDMNGNPVSTFKASKAGVSLSGVQLQPADTGYLALIKSSGNSKIVITDWSGGILIPNAIRAGISTPFYPYSFDRKPDGSLFIFGSLNSPSTANVNEHFIKTDISTNGILPLTGCSVDTTLLDISFAQIFDTTSNFIFSPFTLIPYPNYISDSDIAITQLIDCQLTGIENHFEENSISIFPNPTNGSFQLQGNFPPNSQLHIYNTIGQEVMQPTTLSEENNSVSIHIDVAEGIYFLRIIQSNGEIIQRKLCVVK